MTRAIGVCLGAVVGMLLWAASAFALSPTVIGPIYPLPGYSDAAHQTHGGSSCAQTGDIATDNLTWSFGANPSTTTAETGSACADASASTPFDTTRFQALYWGLDMTSPTGNQVSVGPSINGTHSGCSLATNSVSGPLTYDAADSTPAAGTLVYQGTTDNQDKLTLTFSSGGSAVALTDATTIGSFANSNVNAATLGYVVAVTSGVRNFTVDASYAVHGQPLAHYASSCGETSDISGGFYYTDIPPTGDFTVTAHNHQPAQLHAQNLMDPDGTVASYSWDLTGLGVYGSDANTPNPMTATLGPGHYTVGLQIIDDDGSVTDVTHSFTITNQAPSGSITSSPAVPFSHQTVSFTMSATDPDRGTCANPTWAWDMSGGSSYTTQTASPTATFAPGTHTVAARITDCDGATTRVTHTFTVTAFTAKVRVASGQRLAKVRLHGIKAAFVANDASSAPLKLTLISATGKNGKKIKFHGVVGTAKPVLTRAGTVSFTIKLSSSAKKKLKKAKKASFALAGTATDQFANRAPVKVNFTLK
jgi:methionine-rich copper-binding protein CopC